MKIFASLIKRTLAILTLLTLVMTCYFYFARPYQLNWGGTEQEVKQSMPGDELDSNPEFYATRG